MSISDGPSGTKHRCHIGTMRTFDTGATRDTDEGKPDYRGYLSPAALKRFGQYMTEHRKQSDGGLRASDNWKKGIPPIEYTSSLLRHVFDAWDMYEEAEYRLEAIAASKEWQDLLCAVLFNVQGLIHETLKFEPPRRVAGFTK